MGHLGTLFSTRRLSAVSARHPKAVFAAWAAAIALSLCLAVVVLPGVLTSEQEFTNQPESERGRDLLQQAGLTEPAQARETIVIRSDRYTVDDAAFAELAGGLVGDIQALGPNVVQSVVGYHITGDTAFVSQDRHITILPVLLAGGPEDANRYAETLRETVASARDVEGFEVLQTGNASLDIAFQEIAERDLIKGESIGVAVALVILLLVFGTVVSALVPILMAIVSIAVAIGLSAVVGLLLFDLSFFITNMITMMGLAVGIDYSLFIVSRYREELANGRDKLDAIQASGATASRAVFFSGITVVLALVGLLIIPTTIFRSLGIGAILVVVVSVVAALTLLPALLSALGHRIESLRVRPRPKREAGRPGGFWDWVTHGVMRRPVLSLAAAGGILAAAALPFFDIQTGQFGISSLPDGIEAKEAFVVLEEEFSAGASAGATVVINGNAASDDVRAAVDRLETALEADAAFAPPFVYRTSATERVGALAVQLVGDAVEPQAVDAVRRLRAEHIPAAFAGVSTEVLVSGRTAGSIDFFDLVGSYTPIVFLFVLSLSFVLLTVVFRSLVIPIKSIILNLLSVGAAYGLIVLVMQKGFAVDVFGFQQADVVEAWVPLFLFTVLFGLSMDYHVFLLSRIRERYDETGNNTESVAFGLRATAGLITGAALIMVAVFGGFASGSLVMFQQMGFGLAAAVLIDATIVRSILVPAAMKLMGKVNWYFPSFLDWVPRVGIEGEQVQNPPEAPVPAGGSK